MGCPPPGHFLCIHKQHRDAAACTLARRHPVFLLPFYQPSPFSPPVECPSDEEIRRIVQVALAEDIGGGDVTSLAIVPESAQARASMAAREALVVAGLPVVGEVFRQVSSELAVHREAEDGEKVRGGEILLRVAGPARPILTAERVALNFVQRLSGVATLTRQFVDAIEGTHARILDTRKTTPGLRSLEKYAVACGGGTNHRFGLFDQVLIKDNHLSALSNARPNAIAAAVRLARENAPGRIVEVEADTLVQVEEAVDAGADVILLDNMNLVQLRLAVQQAKGRAKTEASGGISLGSARRVAETGVDYISVGGLTHSARAMDIALDFEI